jgi:bacillithiol biosynthesis deacetylase BshB1
LSSISCMAFGPHPDDVELFCSGFLLKVIHENGQAVIVDLTEGELSTNGDVVLRREEAEAAAKVLGVAERFNARIPDGNIENSLENRLRVIRFIRKVKPDICLIPYFIDRHPDHVAASKLVEDAVFYAGLEKIETGQPPHRPKHLLFYMMHFQFEPSLLVDISREHPKKVEAIACYSSQFSGKGQETYINRSGFIDSLENRARYFGRFAGCAYAEAYFSRDKLKINNLTHFFA